MTVKFQGIENATDLKSFILRTYEEYPVERPPTAPIDVIDFINGTLHFLQADHPVDLLVAVTERGSPVSVFRIAGGAMCLEPFALKITMLYCMMSFYPHFTFIHYDPASAVPTARTDAVYNWLAAALMPMSTSLYDLILVSRDSIYSYHTDRTAPAALSFFIYGGFYDSIPRKTRPFRSRNIRQLPRDG